MIFIDPSLVQNRFTGMPPDWLLAKMFASVSRKSAKNWMAGTEISQTSKRGMASDLNIHHGAEWVTVGHIQLLFSDFEKDSPGSITAPWHFCLDRLTQWILFGYFKGSTPAGVNIFPAASMEELCTLERQSALLLDRIRQDDLDGAMSLLRGELAGYLLFQRKYFGSRWPENIPDMVTLQKALCMATVDSLLYVLALLALSLSKDENGFSEVPSFVRYVPALENGSWNLPLEQWFEELRQVSGSNNLSDLSRKVGTDSTWENWRYNIYRWKGNSKILPPWDAAIDMVSALVKQDDAHVEDIRLYVLFAVARTMQAAHQFFLDNGFPDDCLNTIYSGYIQWYRHHYALNKKTSPKKSQGRPL
jgi:hypothetical protein